MSMKHMVMSVSPALAEEWLKMNTNNRKKRPSTVKKYARAMRDGAWKLTHQGIAFDEDNRLLDGQHRLEAIVQSGATVEMLVCFDVSRDVFAFIDDGAIRNSADRLGKDKNHSEAIRFACRMIFGREPTPTDLIEVDGHIGDTLADLIAFCPTSVKYFSCAAMKVSAVAHILAGSDERYVLETYRSLVLSDLSSMSPSGVALTTQFLKNTLHTNDLRDTVARGVTVFDSARKNNVKIIIKDPDTNYSWVRDVLRSEMRGPLALAA